MSPLAHDEFAGLTHLGSGKVRELFEVGDDAILLVASDRISAYDYVLPTPIPDKGAVLTALSLFWFDLLADVVPGHVLTARVRDYPEELQPYADQLRGRSMLCRRLDMVPVECVARGYLTGSGLKDYDKTGEVCGIALPPGLVDGSRLPEPIFTPATKAEMGMHDENVTEAAAAEAVGRELVTELKRLTLAIFALAGEHAESKGIIVADTKFEFGRDASGTLTLGDEVLTPDSSRFWPVDSYAPGGTQPSYDKQYVRDWLRGSGWDMDSPPPELPEDVVARTREKYVEAYERLTGSSFDSYLREA